MNKKFMLGILLVCISLFTISTAHAGLLCNLGVINGKYTCNLKHGKGIGNYLHTTHDWGSGPDGAVKPTFTLTGETTKFDCTCNTRTFVAVAVDYTLLVFPGRNDAAIIICPAANAPTYDV